MSPKDERTPSARRSNRAESDAKFRRGLASQRDGHFAEADRLYREILRQDPTHFDAQHMLGVMSLQTRQPERAIELIAKAIGISPNIAAAHNNLGYALSAVRRFADAIASYDKAIALTPSFAEAHNNRGNALRELKRHAEAIASYDKAIASKAAYAEAYNGRGSALNELKRWEEALASYDRAIALNPGYVEALYNRGNVLNDLGRWEEALASYDKAVALQPEFAEAHNNRGAALANLKRFDEAIGGYDKAIAVKPNLAGAHNNRGNALKELRRFDEAIASFDTAIALDPGYAEAHGNRGSALSEMKRHENALIAFDRAIGLKPDYAEAHNNWGNTLADLGRHEEAIARYDRAIVLKPEFAEAYYNRGNVLNRLKRYEEAIADYDKVLALKPDHEFALGDLTFTKKNICDWDDLPRHTAEIAAKLERGERAASPFPVLAILHSPELQRKAAEIWVDAKYPPDDALGKIGARPRHGKIRLGYFSADFREHALSTLAAELFERHDRARFEVIAFAFGPASSGAMRKRLEAAFDRFIDVRDLSDRDVASLARNLEIDIAVDLGGFTMHNRAPIFSLRAAPVQVNYLGYPGTMGAPYIDYLIADPTVVPEPNRSYFTEKIAYLPHSFQANDTKRRIADTKFTRSGAGLPEDGFVFCSFNNSYKITPEMFDCWMRLLRRVDGSVLWLAEANRSMATNLRREAALRGIPPERVVFAPLLPYQEHLARHRLADLFLDTLPYNAHTTASDALWTGLPVLTQIGETYIGRAAASLLRAVGLPELVTTTSQAYEDLAFELATNPDKLAAIKRRLADNRLTEPLFDTPLFTKHIEAAYIEMYELNHAGLPPDHIHVNPVAAGGI